MSNYLIPVISLSPAGSTSIHHDKRGECAEKCDMLGTGHCLAEHSPTGWECVPYGCGHRCRNKCPNVMVMAACRDMWCTNGYAKDAQGCEICKCAEDVIG